jgi:hypothetical protein
MNKIKKLSKKTKKYRVYAQMGSDLYCDVEAKSIQDVKNQIEMGLIDAICFTEDENSGWWEYGAIDEIE